MLNANPTFTSAAAGTSVDSTDPAMFRNSIPPERIWLIRSVSLPNWLLTNSLISSRPPVAARMRSIPSWARKLTGLPGDCPVANLNSNSAARAGRVRMANSGRAAPAIAARRDRPGFVVSLMRPSPGTRRLEALG